MPLFDSKWLGLRSLFSCRCLDYVIVNALIRARARKASFGFSLLGLELTQELTTVCYLHRTCISSADWNHLPLLSSDTLYTFQLNLGAQSIWGDFPTVLNSSSRKVLFFFLSFYFCFLSLRIILISGNSRPPPFSGATELL